MDYLWTPWRYAYVTEMDREQRQGVPEELSGWPGDSGCVFCNMIAAVDYAQAHGIGRDEAERAALIVLRTESNYVCLNRYPYTSGHLMVVPYEHQASLTALSTATLHEMMDLAQRAERVLAEVYRPGGFNFGLNLGKAAGAGIAGHLHLHALPRWVGDTNFMSVLGETRVLPEELDVTWKRMRDAFAADSPPSTPTPGR
ncbi:MAG: HIT domain-containing protein [Acidobacteriaceae bacterium]